MSENNTEIQNRVFQNAISELHGERSLDDIAGPASGVCQRGAGYGMPDGVPTAGCGMLFACGAYRTADQLHRV